MKKVYIVIESINTKSEDNIMKNFIQYFEKLGKMCKLL